MSTMTVSQLHQRMIEDMCLRNLAPRTQEAYIRGCKRLAVFLRDARACSDAENHPRSDMSHRTPNTLQSIQARQSSLLSSMIYAIDRNQLDPPSHRATLNRHRARRTDGAPPFATSCIATLPTPAVGVSGLVVMAGIRKPLQKRT